MIDCIPRYLSELKYRYRQSGRNKRQSPISPCRQMMEPSVHLQTADQQHIILLFVCLSLLQHTCRLPPQWGCALRHFATAKAWANSSLS